MNKGKPYVEFSVKVLKEKLDDGGYCKKGISGCACDLGWPYEMQCPDCRDKWEEHAFRDSYCICSPTTQVKWWERNLIGGYNENKDS
jgi:predicted amidophosphoribosyltransferase